MSNPIKPNIIKYRSGYKFQLADTYYVDIGADLETLAVTKFIALDGRRLVISAGYAWDGPSGPTFASKSSMRASLVHDALYQLLREGHLPPTLRGFADDLLYAMCVEDGMWKWRAAMWRRAVKKFAGFAADPANIKQVLEAP